MEFREIGDEGQEFLAGTHPVERTRVVQLGPKQLAVVGVNPDWQLHLEELLRAGETESASSMIDTTARWAFYGGGQSGAPLLRLDVKTSQPVKTELRLLFDPKRDRKLLRVAVASNSVLLLNEEKLDVLSPRDAVLRSVFVSNIPSRLVSDALRASA